MEPRILFLMPHSYAIRLCPLIALLLLSSTTFVQTTIIDIPYTDERVLITPKTDWSEWSYNGTVACPGIWTEEANELRTISLNFTGIGIAVYGFAEPRPAPWRFRIDDEPPEVLLIQPNTECRPIKDRQGLKDERHRVTVTPLERSFVLTKFSVTEADTVNEPTLTTGEIIGIAIGSTSALLAVPGVYFGYREWSRRRKM